MTEDSGRAHRGAHHRPARASHPLRALLAREAPLEGLDELHGRPVTVELSGGVDSAVAAAMAVAAGARVEALFVKSWEEDDSPGACTAAEDLRSAEAVCDHLGIPLRTANFSAEYWDRVFEPFVAEHRRGRTPNPDVLCNREIKLGETLRLALERGAELVLTGHYARVHPDGPRTRLLRSLDGAKDQTYFLYRVPAPALARTRFPLGVLTKDRVRSLARRLGLPNHARPDSTGICFIGERRFPSFLARWVDAPPGPIREPGGRVLGEHRGLPFYTVGQRQGLGIGGRRGHDGRPWYVAGKDPGENALIVVAGGDHPALMARSVVLEQVHWIGPPPPLPLACRARARHRQPLAPCRVRPLEPSRGTLEVSFEVPLRAAAPGQSVVLYDREICLGGGVISEVRTLAPLSLPARVRARPFRGGAERGSGEEAGARPS